MIIINIVWKDVSGYEDYYEISSEKQVRRKDSGNILTPFRRKGVKSSEKLYVAITVNGKTRSKSIDMLYRTSFNIDGDIESFQGEIWKDVCGWHGIYQVSNKGRVKSLDRYINQCGSEGKNYKRFVQGRLLSVKRNNGNGYIMVQFSNGNEKYAEGNEYIHALVAKHFIENKHGKPTVNHKDGNKSNNKVENLEWATYSEQIRHALDTGLSVKSGRKLSENEVLEIRDLHKNKFSISYISEIYGVSKGTVSNIVNRRSWKKI